MERVAVGGGNGKIGRAILRELDRHGYWTVNCSIGERTESVADRYQRVDLTDAGAVYAALARTDVDAVAHVGTIPRPTEHPAHEVYHSNVQSAQTILEACHDLGIERVVLPSSVNVLGAAYQDEPVEVEYLPVDEEHPLAPRDPYAVAKHAMEVTADGIARRRGAPSIASLRFPWVATSDQLRDRFGDDAGDLDALAAEWAGATRDVLCAYLHLEDAGTAVRHALEADLEGHERFWLAADDPVVDVPVERVIERYYPDAELREELSGRDPLVDTSKARETLDWTPERSWRELE